LKEWRLLRRRTAQQTLTSIKEFNPDIVLLDVPEAGLSGLELLKEIVEKFPRVRVIVVTQHENQEQAVQALRWGAAGLISKGVASTELELAIKAVARGESYLTSELSKQAVLKREAKNGVRPNSELEWGTNSPVGKIKSRWATALPS